LGAVITSLFAKLPTAYLHVVLLLYLEQTLPISRYRLLKESTKKVSKTVRALTKTYKVVKKFTFFQKLTIWPS